VKFCHDLYRNWNMKIVVNEHSFLLVTHMTYFNVRFGSYGFFKSGYDAELFWTGWTFE
jgi:hypothetical protein